MDFDLAGKHKKEVEQRRRDAKRKLEAQKRDEETKKVMEQEHRAREEVRLRIAEEERQKAEEEARLNEGIQFVTRLRPYPSVRTDDKLELPPSALAELERQGAIERGTLLTFKVSLTSSPVGTYHGDALTGQTHAGVAEFTAEEGTVGVPPRVALCLSKGAGLDTLAAVGQVEVRYFRLPRSPKSRVKFQPRGEGFHVGGASIANIDLEHVLQETLRGHTALTEGDWLPIRHDGYTYELVVRELEPDPFLALLDTDLTVEVLPSEKTEAELRAEEERKAREEAAQREAEERERRRIERARAKAEALGPEPEPGAEVVQLRVRLPSGAQLSRRFARAALFRDCLTWVESEPDTKVAEDEFRLVQKWPGHCRELGPEEASQTLDGLKFARQEALFLQHLSGSGEIAADEAMPDAQAEAGVGAAQAPAPAASGAAAKANCEWAAAEERAHEELDARLDGSSAQTPTAALREQALGEVRGAELVGVFERLRALGMEPNEAAATSKRFAAQLKELGEMGFEDWIEASRLLDKYNGRLLRVANLLSESAGADSGVDSDRPARSASPPVPSPPAPAPSAPAPAAAVAAQAAAPRQEAPDGGSRAAGAAIDKEVVHTKFRELVAAGVAPNDAATQAIQLVRQAAAAAGPAETSQAGGGEDPAKLDELLSMGFTDLERNRELLRKYAGRMQRVIEALCAG